MFTGLADLTDLLLPRGCVGCGAPGSAFCAACRPAGQLIETVVARLPVYAAGQYGGGLRTALLAYKERGRHDLARPLAGALAVAVLGAVDEIGRPVVLVPVPSSARARRERGGDHVLRLCRRVSRATGWPTVAALRLAREVRDSAGLGVDDRWRNLDGAMAAIRSPSRSVALLIDDIVTTGATLSEAARALSGAGWQVPAAAVLAATARRGPQSS